MRLAGFDRGLRLGDLGRGSFDSCLRLRNARVLQRFLTLVVFDGGFACPYTSHGLLYLGAIVIVLELHQQITGFHFLVIVDGDLRDCSRDARAERCQVGSQVGVIGLLCLAAPGPGIPVACDGVKDCGGEQQNGDGNQEVPA